MIDLRNKCCLDVLDELHNEDVKLDCVVTDPPYLIKYKTGWRKDREHEFCSEIENDDFFDFETWASRTDKILKDDSFIYIFGTWKTEPYFREIFSNIWSHKNNIIWVKNSWTAGDLKSQYGQQYELIMLYVKGRPEFKDKRYSDVWKFDRVAGNTQIHQNEKPVELIKRIISNSTKVNDLVMDSFVWLVKNLVENLLEQK